MPTVSVIIPTYNRAHLIGRSIQSVLTQTYEDFELIIVDDGSTDNTEEIVMAFNDHRISYLKQSSNRGVSAARNIGIKAARGSYIAFQDSDDEWLPQKLEKQVALFEEDKKGDLGLVLCETLGVSQHGELRVAPQIDKLNCEQLISYLGAYGEGTQRFVLKRDITAPELYFDEHLKAWEEWDLMLRVSRICRIDYVKEALVRHYYHGGPQLDNAPNRLRARRVLFHKYAAELKKRPKSAGISHWHSALDYFRLGQMDHMRRELRIAIKAYPWNPELYFDYLISFFGPGGYGLFMKLRYFYRLLLRRTMT